MTEKEIAQRNYNAAWNAYVKANEFKIEALIAANKALDILTAIEDAERSKSAIRYK